MTADVFAFPLSFAQQRLWFLDQLVPGNAFYNIPAAFRFSFALNEAVLRRSLDDIVRRHESLRTTFRVERGEPFQVVTPELTLQLPVIDLRSMPSAERESEASRLAADEARRPFDLERGPLIRTTLVRLGETDYLFLLTLHHIVSDGWSMLVLSRELTALYTAFAMDRPSPLPDLAVQYPDYAVWQRESLAGDNLEAELAWWRERLAHLPVLQLPTDRPRPTVATYEGAAEPLRLPATLCAALRSLSQREGATLFMTLWSGFAVLLHRYSGQTDIVVGAPVAGRNRAELEGLIGFFVNTLVLRADLSGDPTFRELLGRVRQATTAAYAHQELPFEKLVEELQPERDLGRNPLFQVIFQLFSHLGLDPTSHQGQGAPVGVQRGAAVFDLAFNLWEGPAEVVGQIEFSTALYDAGTVARMAAHYRMLLDAIAARPDQPISRLPILTSAERRQVVVDWNQTATPYPRDHCIHTLFEEQARATPEAVALDFAGERLSYRELNLRANRLAHHLRGLGVEAESLVGICLERSLELVVALVAVLKAGGAYVPLDPGYPDERLRFMAADCGLAVVITRAGLAPRLDLPGVRRVCVDDDADWVRAPIEEGPATAVSPENLAYVIYTSGSTGQPKGALIPHRGVVRLVKETQYVALNADDTLLQFAPISFDASTFEIWGALLNGARLAIFPPHIPTLEELGAFILEQQITTLWLTASLFQQMVDGPLDTLRQVRQLLAGGDVLPASAARRFLERFPGARLINGYGPTENTTFTCCHVMTQPDHAGSAVPIGRPISNTRVYLLDPHLEPVPIGVPGELFTGGDGLARGYLSRPDLTAERFVSDPFSTEQGARLYRTGDLARYRADGRIEFLGRIDQQVKIRGFRIELAEVEAALLGHPGVQEAVVVARQHADGDKYLVAYLVRQPDAPFADAAAPDDDGSRMVREFLRRRLPDFMVPARFVTLDALPLNPNGKVDRRALPEPDAERPAARSWTAPRTQVETTLAGMWSELLGVGRVGVDDHFFADLGGHSLRATQVVSRIREAFAVHLELRTIFEAPTVAELASVIEDRLLREIEALDATEVRTLLGEGLAGMTPDRN